MTAENQDSLFPANDNPPEPWNFWHGLDILKLPRTASAAAELGIRFFYTGVACIHGHEAPKYTKGGRCCACSLLSSARTADRGYGRGLGAARANLTRAIASMGYGRTYTPLTPCKHGHSERFVSSNNCVECSRLAALHRREKAKDKRLIRKYGLTLGSRDRMAEGQGNSCAICHEEFSDNRAMHVDHCHETGKVRGILCSQCNQGIGLLRDNPTIIRAAAAYVEFHAYLKEAA